MMKILPQTSDKATLITMWAFAHMTLQKLAHKQLLVAPHATIGCSPCNYWLLPMQLLVAPHATRLLICFGSCPTASGPIMSQGNVGGSEGRAPLKALGASEAPGGSHA